MYILLGVLFILPYIIFIHIRHSTKISKLHRNIYTYLNLCWVQYILSISINQICTFGNIEVTIASIIFHSHIFFVTCIYIYIYIQKHYIDHSMWWFSSNPSDTDWEHVAFGVAGCVRTPILAIKTINPHREAIALASEGGKCPTGTRSKHIDQWENIP